MNLAQKTAFSFFRMGLVTGLVAIDDLVAWADRQILQEARPSEEVIELSLSGRLPHSRLIWLLSAFEGAADYDLALKLLLAVAGMVWGRDSGRTREVIMGLRLLNEEEYFPRSLKVRIADLRQDLELAERDLLATAELDDRLAAFLEPFAAYRDTVLQVLGRNSIEPRAAHR